MSLADGSHQIITSANVPEGGQDGRVLGELFEQASREAEAAGAGKDFANKLLTERPATAWKIAAQEIQQHIAQALHVIATGTPEQVAAEPSSHTGRTLREILAASAFDVPVLSSSGPMMRAGSSSGSANTGMGSVGSSNITWNIGLWVAWRSGCRCSTTVSNGISECA